MRAISALLLSAQFLALGHLLIVRHTICPEHGEMIHSGPSGAVQAMRPIRAGAAVDPALDGGAVPSEHAHDHCRALANTRERFAMLPALDLMPGSLLVATTGPTLSYVALAPAVAVLLLAPKNSPPSA
jgi:hypothetical protein